MIHGAPLSVHAMTKSMISAKSKRLSGDETDTFHNVYQPNSTPVFCSSQMFDISGNGAPYDVNYNLYGVCSSKGNVLIRLELLSVATISEVELYPLNRDRNRAHLYDRENQAWLLETDVSMEKLKLRLCYTDVTNVPRKFTRFVCWR